MHERRELLRKGALVCVVAGVVISPWLFGAAEPWAYISVSLLVGCGMVCWLAHVVVHPEPSVRAPWATLGLVALAAFVGVQLLPLPLSVVEKVSPLSAQVQEGRAASFQAMRQAGADDYLLGGPGSPRRTGTLSVSAAATRRSFFLFVAYLSAFLVTANAFRKWAELRAAAGALAVSGFVMAAVGIAHKFSGSSLILWFHVPRFGGSIFGPFTNRNHYAAHMNMTVGLTLGLLVAASVVRLSGLQTWRERLTWLSTRTANRLVLLGFALAVMAGSVWVSLSRGGISSLVIALGAVGVGTVVLGGGRSRARLAAAVALLLAGALLWVGWRPIFERMGTLAQVDPVSDSRMAATRATLAIFARAPLAGDGFGSFQHVFPMFQKPDIQFGRWLHAHNDYAQLLAEGGILGALLAALTAGMLIGSVARRFRRATPQCRAMVTGLAVAVVTIALHSLVDYGLHKPANAFMLAAVCGMSVAAVHVRAKRLRSAESSGQEDEEREHRAEKEDGPVAASRA